MSKRSKGSEGFRENPRAMKILRQFVESRAADGMRPKSLMDSRDCFQKIGLKKFRDALNRLKRERLAELLQHDGLYSG